MIVVWNHQLVWWGQTQTYTYEYRLQSRATNSEDGTHVGVVRDLFSSAEKGIVRAVQPSLHLECAST